MRRSQKDPPGASALDRWSLFIRLESNHNGGELTAGGRGRLGITCWFRVVEVQSQSGDGWIHWHCIVDLGGTEFDLSSIKKRAWIDLSTLRTKVMRHWCERWQLGGIAGQDIQLVKSKHGVVGYLANYVTKAWPAIPLWVLERNMFRLVGFSGGANQRLRDIGFIEPREQPRRKRTERKRPVERLLERLARSGLSSKVILDGAYHGDLPAPPSDVVLLRACGAPIETIIRVFENRTSTIRRAYFGL